MAIITSGKTFANGEQLTADKLNQVITAATFATSAIDNSVMQIVGDAITIADGGVATAKIADSNVTKAKIENVANMKALGNTSGSATSPQEVAILDEDTMSSDSDTSLATQQSIKAFVETSKTSSFTPTTYTGGESVTFPNGLIMKFGQQNISISGGSIVFETEFPNACISVQGTCKRADSNNNMGVTAFSKTQITCNPNTTDAYTWLAIGH
jgi:hypothetical protein